MLISSDYLRHPQPKAFETSDYLYINGQAHDKVSLSPIASNCIYPVSEKSLGVPANMYITNAPLDLVTFFKETTYTTYSNLNPSLVPGNNNVYWNNFYNLKRYIIDNVDSNICYVIIGSQYCNLLKIDTRTNKILGNYQFSNAGIISQDEESIYLWFSTSNIYSHWSATTKPNYSISKVNKSNMTINSIGQGNSSFNAVHENSKFIYSLALDSQNYTINIRVFDKTSVSFIKNYTAPSAGLWAGYYGDYNIEGLLNGDDLELYFPFIYSASPYNFIIQKMILSVRDEDVVGLTPTKETIDVDYSKDEGVKTRLSIRNSNNRLSYIITNGTKKYLILYLYNTVQNSSSIDSKGIFIFEILENSLVFKNEVKIDSLERGIFFVDEKKEHVVIPSDIKTYQFRFNYETETYEKISEIDLVAATINKDDMNRLWVLDKNSNLHLLDETVGDKVNLRFENENLHYVGNELSNNLIISATNFNNDRVEANVDLKISGNAVFESNSSKTISITTSATDNVIVPVKISGPGQLYVYPTLTM